MTDTETLKKLIKDLKLDVNASITAENFPFQDVRGEVKIFQFDDRFGSEEVIEKLSAEGYEPANLYEILAWAQDGWNGKDFVVALGSSWVDPFGFRLVPFLDQGGDGRDLDLHWWGLDRGGVGRYLSLHWWGCRWDADCRFAGVRKSPDTQKSDHE